MQVTTKILLLSISSLMSFVSVAKDIDQSTLCTTSSTNVAENSKQCKKGQKIAFLPNSFGNEQLPILFIAGHCDLDYSVNLTNGGAVCIFNPVENLVEVKS